MRDTRTFPMLFPIGAGPGAGVGVTGGQQGTGDGDAGNPGGDNTGQGDNQSGHDGQAGQDGQGQDGQLGETGIRALHAEREAARDAKSRATELSTENEQLKARVDELERAGMTEEERRQREADDDRNRIGESATEIATLKTANDNLTTEVSRLNAALEAGLPKNWAGRIQGATPEEMAADAKTIKESLRDTEYTPGVGATGSTNVETAPGMERIRNAYATSK